MAWVYVGVCITGMAVNAAILRRTNPKLIAGRAERRPGTKGWDRIFAVVATRSSPAVHIALGAIPDTVVGGWDSWFRRLFWERCGVVTARLNCIADVVRTALEDRTLRDDLPGYRVYAQRVRYRLVPGNWCGGSVAVGGRGHPGRSPGRDPDQSEARRL